MCQAVITLWRDTAGEGSLEEVNYVDTEYGLTLDATEREVRAFLTSKQRVQMRQQHSLSAKGRSRAKRCKGGGCLCRKEDALSNARTLQLEVYRPGHVNRLAQEEAREELSVASAASAEVTTHQQTSHDQMPHSVDECIPLRSHLKEKSDLPTELVGRLRAFAACMVREKLSTRCDTMNILAPMGMRSPRAEALLNTKLSFQFSQEDSPGMNSSPVSRTCSACSGRLARCVCGQEVCDGNKCAAGQRFQCDKCSTEYTIRWAYETGSGLSSIGRNPGQFQILPFTKDMEDMVKEWEADNDNAPKYNNIVLVIYCGAAMCAHCALHMEHKTIQHGTTLGFHQDLGGGANSQRAETVIRTLNLGHPRQLTMQMRACHGLKEDWTYVTQEDEDVHFILTDSSEFVLDASSDEATRWRPTKYGPRRCSWFHGMQTPISANDISCGLVAREVTHVREVRLSDDVVINHKQAWSKSARQKAFQRAQILWQHCSATYARIVTPKVEFALSKWNWPAPYVLRAQTARVSYVDSDSDEDSIYT